MTKDEALKLAQKALEEWNTPLYKRKSVINVIKKALAHPEQEPVAVIGSGFQLLWCRQDWSKGLKVGDCLYTTPPQRKPLTDEEIEDIWADCPADWDDKINVLTLARAIEAAHGIAGEKPNAA